MFSESEYALTELGSASRLRRGSGGAHEGTSSNMIKVLEHWVRQDDPVIDELSDEAGLYELRVQRESVYIRGELVAPRRVFVTVPGFEGYEHVGWIVRIDCKSCMVCAKPFAREAEKMNCNACGNVVCKVRCGGNSGIVAELPPGVGPVLVCVQCYWGQEPVHAVIHEDELISPFIVRRTRSNISAYGNQASALRKLSTDSNRASLNVGFGLSTESKAKFETAETVAPRAVTPVPRFVLLTKTHAGRSLYVNVLEHNAIAPGTFVAGPVPREGVDRRQSGSGIAELERDGSAKADTSGMAGESYLIFDVSCNTDELNHAMTSENTDVLKCICVDVLETVGRIFHQKIIADYRFVGVSGNYKGGIDETVQLITIPILDSEVSDSSGDVDVTTGDAARVAAMAASTPTAIPESDTTTSTDRPSTSTTTTTTTTTAIIPPASDPMLTYSSNAYTPAPDSAIGEANDSTSIVLSESTKLVTPSSTSTQLSDISSDSIPIEQHPVTTTSTHISNELELHDVVIDSHPGAVDMDALDAASKNQDEIELSSDVSSTAAQVEHSSEVAMPSSNDASAALAIRSATTTTTTTTTTTSTATTAAVEGRHDAHLEAPTSHRYSYTGGGDDCTPAPINDIHTTSSGVATTATTTTTTAVVVANHVPDSVIAPMAYVEIAATSAAPLAESLDTRIDPIPEPATTIRMHPVSAMASSEGEGVSLAAKVVSDAPAVDAMSSSEAASTARSGEEEQDFIHTTTSSEFTSTTTTPPPPPPPLSPSISPRASSLSSLPAVFECKAPSAVIVLKTRTKSNPPVKIFINICSHPLLPSGQIFVSPEAKRAEDFEILDALCNQMDVTNAVAFPSGEQFVQICQSILSGVATRLQCTLADDYSFPKTRNNYKSLPGATSGGASVGDVWVQKDLLSPILSSTRASLVMRETQSGRQSILSPARTSPHKPPSRMGWLRKQGHIVSNWKRRYFVLFEGKLTYYEDAAESPPYGSGLKGEFVLANATVRLETTPASDGGKGRGSGSKTPLYRLVLTHTPSKKQLVMESPDEREQNSWAFAISEHINFATLSAQK